MPAEVSLYLLNFVDRIIIVRSAGLAEAGLYSLAVKFAQAVNVLVRGFQLAWPPLAYSIRDDDEARRAYATIVTLFVAGCAFVVTGMWLFSRWIVRALAAPEFFGSYKAIGLISTAVTLYALYMVLVVILGRTGRTEFNFPATIAALVANVVLNLLLVPPLGIVGAGLALVASYLVVLALMYGFTQRLFPVPYEWGRLARVVLDLGGPRRRRRTADADLRLRRPARPRRPLRRLPARPLRQRLLHPRRARLARPPAPPGRAGWPSCRACAPSRRRRRPRPGGLRGRAMDEDAARPMSRCPMATFGPSAGLARSRIDARWAGAPGGRGPSRRGRAGRAGRWRRGRGRRRTRR